MEFETQKFTEIDYIERKLGLTLKTISIVYENEVVDSKHNFIRYKDTTATIYVTPLARKYFENLRQQKEMEFDSKNSSTLFLGKIKRIVNGKINRNPKIARNKKIDANILMSLGISINEFQRSCQNGVEHGIVNIAAPILEMARESIIREAIYQVIGQNKEVLSEQVSAWDLFIRLDEKTKDEVKRIENELLRISPIKEKIRTIEIVDDIRKGSSTVSRITAQNLNR